MKKLILIVFSTLVLNANSLLIENNLGRGGVSLAVGEEMNSILLNPANIPLNAKRTFNIMDGNIVLGSESMHFIKDLMDASKSTGSDKNKQITDLLNEHIGEPLHVSANNFSFFYESEENFSWLIGILNSVDASFVTHTGFGSFGALESQVDQYHGLITTLGTNYNGVQYALNIKALNRYQILHNYSILDMLEADTISYYFDNEYQKKKFAVGFDGGIIYDFQENLYNAKVAFSTLNIGGTDFEALGSIQQTSNIGFSMNPYETLLVGIDYMDIFDQSNAPYQSDNLRLGISKRFFEDRVELSSGLYNQELTLGLNYEFSWMRIGLSTYAKKGYNNKPLREYQMNLAFFW